MTKPSIAMRIQEFSRRTGVTVRTLHHYDKLGLLRPAARTEAGYRLYGEQDLIRLQQIATLKFIGCSLGEIKRILAGPPTDLSAIFVLQHEALEHKRQAVERALLAVERAQRMVKKTGKADWEALQEIIEVMEMNNDKTWMRKYYTEEQLEELGSRDPALRAKGETGWSELIPAIESAAREGMDPGSEAAAALLQRRQELIEMFTGAIRGFRVDWKSSTPTKRTGRRVTRAPSQRPRKLF